MFHPSCGACPKGTTYGMNIREQNDGCEPQASNAVDYVKPQIQDDEGGPEVEEGKFPGSSRGGTSEAEGVQHTSTAISTQLGQQRSESTTTQKKLVQMLVQLAVSATLVKVVTHIKRNAENYAIINVGDNGDDRTPDDAHATFFVKGIYRTLSLDFDPKRSCDSVLKEVQDREQLALDEFSLVYAGTHLEEGRLLADYNIQRSSTVFLALGLSGGVKRGRVAENPFETSMPDTIVQSDADPINRAFVSAIELGSGADMNVVEKLGTMSTPDLKNAMELIKHGKQNNNVKVQQLAEMLPELKHIRHAATKFQDTYDVQLKRVSAAFWKFFLDQSNGKLSIDVVKMAVTSTLRARDGMHD